MLDFLNIRFVDILDIVLVAVLIFYAFRLLKGTQTMSIFLAIGALYAARIVCNMFDMKLTAGLLGAIMDVGLVALIVIFQPEIRRFLAALGRTYRNAGRRTGLARLFRNADEKVDMDAVYDEVCQACDFMSLEKCGALIVFQRETPLGDIIETGDIVDARVSCRLLRNIFFKNSPLHDGAVIIRGDRIVAARCTLPMSDQELPPQYGMRHRAAVGISEQSDAVIVVVSEETGGITVMTQGKLHSEKDAESLKKVLQNG